MKYYQEFRLKGSDPRTDSTIIEVDILASGEKVIFIKDIERMFPNAGDFLNGKRSVKLVKDSNHDW